MSSVDPTVGSPRETALPPDRVGGGTGWWLTGGGRLRGYLGSVGVLFTVLTVISSTIALGSGEQAASHRHLLLRLLFVVLGLGAVELVVVLRRRLPSVPLVVHAVAGTVVLLAAVVLSLWVAGQAGVELHPDAYRDAVLNVAAVGVGLTLLSAGADLLRRRRR